MTDDALDELTDAAMEQADIDLRDFVATTRDGLRLAAADAVFLAAAKANQAQMSSDPTILVQCTAMLASAFLRIAQENPPPATGRNLLNKASHALDIFADGARKQIAAGFPTRDVWAAAFTSSHDQMTSDPTNITRGAVMLAAAFIRLT